MLFNFEFDVTVFDVPEFDITLLYLKLEFKYYGFEKIKKLETWVYI
jgi:hypothetical protein